MKHSAPLPPPYSAEKAYTRVSLSLFCYLLTSLILSMIISAVAMNVNPSLINNDLFELGVMVFSQYIIGILLVFLIVRKLPVYRYMPERMTCSSFLGTFTACVAIAFVGNQIGRLITALLENQLGYDITDRLEQTLDGPHALISYTLVAVLGPIMEEVLFRHLLLDRLRPYGEKNALLFTAVTFGLSHGNVMQLFYATGVGLVLGYVYLRTKNFWYPILLHCLFNLLLGVLPAFIQRIYPDSVAGVGEGMLFLGLLTVFELVATVVGIIWLIRKRKQLYLPGNAFAIKKGRVFTTVYLNVGTILYFVLVLAIFVLGILPQNG